MSAEEFILIPKSMYLPQRPAIEQVLHNPSVATGRQLSLLQRYSTPKEAQAEPEPLPVAPKSIKDAIFDSLVSLNEAQRKKANVIYETAEASERLSIDNNGQILIDYSPTGLSMGAFLHSLQQPTKKLDPTYETILTLLAIPDYLVSNKSAKAIIENAWISFTAKARRMSSTK